VTWRGDMPSGRPGDFGDLGPLSTERTTYLLGTKTPVHCFPVTLGGRLIGYVWASATVDAAGYRAKPGTGAIGFDAAGRWGKWLTQAWEDGVNPLDAVRGWVGAPDDPIAGRIPADAEEYVLPDSESVHLLAGGKWGKEDGE
jgi:hypothetical protein